MNCFKATAAIQNIVADSLKEVASDLQVRVSRIERKQDAPLFQEMITDNIADVSNQQQVGATTSAVNTTHDNTHPKAVIVYEENPWFQQGRGRRKLILNQSNVPSSQLTNGIHPGATPEPNLGDQAGPKANKGPQHMQQNASGRYRHNAGVLGTANSDDIANSSNQDG